MTSWYLVSSSDPGALFFIRNVPIKGWIPATPHWAWSSTNVYSPPERLCTPQCYAFSDSQGTVQRTNIWDRADLLQHPSFIQGTEVRMSFTPAGVIAREQRLGSTMSQVSVTSPTESVGSVSRTKDIKRQLSGGVTSSMLMRASIVKRAHYVL